MSNLSEKDLAILSALVYCDTLIEQDTGSRLCDWINLYDGWSDEKLGALPFRGDFNFIKEKEGVAAAGAKLREFSSRDHCLYLC